MLAISSLLSSGTAVDDFEFGSRNQWQWWCVELWSHRILCEYLKSHSNSAFRPCIFFCIILFTFSCSLSLLWWFFFLQILSFFPWSLFSCAFLHFSSIHATRQIPLRTVLFTVYCSLLLLSSCMAFTLFTFNFIIIIVSTVPHSIILSLIVVPIQINQYILRWAFAVRAHVTHITYVAVLRQTHLFFFAAFTFSRPILLSVSCFLFCSIPRSADFVFEIYLCFFFLQHDYFCDDDHISLAFMSLMLLLLIVCCLFCSYVLVAHFHSLFGMCSIYTIQKTWQKIFLCCVIKCHLSSFAQASSWMDAQSFVVAVGSSFSPEKQTVHLYILAPIPKWAQHIYNRNFKQPNPFQPTIDTEHFKQLRTKSNTKTCGCLNMHFIWIALCVLCAVFWISLSLSTLSFVAISLNLYAAHTLQFISYR